MDNEKLISLIESIGFEAHHSDLALVFYYKNHKIHCYTFWNIIESDDEVHYYSFYETLTNDYFYNYI